MQNYAIRFGSRSDYPDMSTFFYPNTGSTLFDNEQHYWMHERGNMVPWLLRPLRGHNAGWWRAGSTQVYTVDYLQTLEESGDYVFERMNPPEQRL